ncbi:TauD/TfdA dioxygenase family protein [Streptomyces sp. NPDC054813]
MQTSATWRRTEGVDLSQEIPAEQLDEIRTAFRDHHVLVFRDQTIIAEDHRRFAAAFGELRPVNPPPPEGDPYILEIRTTSAAADVAGDGWHADGTADAEPPLGSMLYITEIPEPGCGGDTLFANMHLAYDMLSPAMRTPTPATASASPSTAAPSRADGATRGGVVPGLHHTLVRTGPAEGA